MELTGKIKLIKEEKQVSAKFKLREIVITDDSTQYVQHIPMQVTQDRCSLIDNYSVGDTVKVSLNIKGREWTSPAGEVKYFATLEIWRVELVSRASEQSQVNTDDSDFINHSQAPANTVQPEGFTPSDGQDLPF